MALPVVAGVGLLYVVARLVNMGFAFAKANKGTSLLTGLGLGAVVLPMPDLSQLREWAFGEFGDSDSEALEEAVRVASRMLNNEGEEVLMPFSRRLNEYITPQYITLGLMTGRAWASQHYYSKKSLDAAFRRGQKFGRRAELREQAQEVTLHKGVN